MDVQITLKNYRCFSDEKPARFTIGDSIVAFVGVNNSGKSSLLRFFYEFRHLFASLKDVPFILQSYRRSDGGPFPLQGLTDTREIFCTHNERPIQIELHWPEEMRPDFPTRLLLEVPRVFNVVKLQLVRGDGQFVNLHDPNVETTVHFSSLVNICTDLADSIYVGSFRNVLNVQSPQPYFDLTVGQSFIRQWRSWKTGTSKDQNEAISALTEEIRRIFSFDSLEINAAEDNTTLQLLVNGKSLRLPELGSGLAQFIIVLATTMMRKPSYVFMDEPELSLHPSLQLDFLTTVASYAKRGLVFATHSFGLARSGAEQIYTLRKGQGGTSEVLPLQATPRLSEFTGELSFSGYQDVGFATVLLVEGRTDIKTIQHFLRLFGVEHHVVLLPLGGNALINGLPDTEDQLIEVKRICADVQVLIDSERDALDGPISSNREAFLALCKRAGIPCCVLKRRAIENYFSDAAVKRAKGDSYSALQPFEKLVNHSPGWSKNENWRMARFMTKDELLSSDLGQFLADVKPSKA